MSLPADSAGVMMSIFDVLAVGADKVPQYAIRDVRFPLYGPSVDAVRKPRAHWSWWKRIADA